MVGPYRNTETEPPTQTSTRGWFRGLRGRIAAGIALFVVLCAGTLWALAATGTGALATIVLIVAHVVGLLCVRKLWCEDLPLSRRILWTLVLVLPVMGPIFYGAFFDPPSIQDKSDQARPTSSAMGYRG